MKLLSDALLGFMAGLVITLGATAYLLLDNIMAGALMFTVGLFAICSFGWNLFTGKVCYSIGKGPRYIGYQSMIATLVDPFLRPVRRVVPRLGRWDLSPAILFIVLCLLLRLITPLSMGLLML